MRRGGMDLEHQLAIEMGHLLPREAGKHTQLVFRIFERARSNLAEKSSTGKECREFTKDEVHAGYQEFFEHTRR